MGRSPILLAVLAGGVLASLAAAQPQAPQEGPIIVGKRRENWKPFTLERFSAAYEFLGEYRTERLRLQNGNELVDKETLFRQALDLTGEASIGHKNFIDLTGTAQFGLDNRISQNDAAGDTAREWDFLNLYDVRALMLANGPAPTTVYNRREQSIIDQNFGGRIEQTLMESGFITQFRSEVAPTTIQYFHRRQEFDNPFEQPDSITTQDTFTGQSGIRLSSNQRLDVAYTYDHISEDQGVIYTDTLDRHDANIVHTVDFGPEIRRHELRSSLRIYDQSGRFAQDDTRVDELLVLRHTDRLETRYSGTVDEQTRGGQDQRLYRGEASVRHKLFQSLVSSASVGGQRFTGPDNFTSDDTFGSGQLDYTKKVPWGRLDASGGVTYDAQDNSSRGSPLAVTNDAKVRTDPAPIIIPRRNVTPGTLVLLPAAGFPPFIEGTDYTVRYFPDRVEISIPPGSAIQNGQTVLANYTIGPEPGNQINTLGTSANGRYTLTEGTLRGLSGYANYRTVDQQVTAVDPSTIILDDFRDLVLGVEYTRSGLDLKYEHEKRWSNVLPFDSDRVQTSYNQPLGRDSTLNLEYTHETTTYPLIDNRLDFDRVTGRWNQRISPTFDFNVRLEYRNERDDLNGNSEGFDQIIGFTWRKGQTTIYATVQNATLRGPASDRTSQLFQLGLRRDF